MLLNQLHRLGAASHEALPARWQQIVGDANVQRVRRHLPLIEFRWTGEQVPAYVNRGAWVASCPECNGGIAVSPEWAPCACLDCGRIYESITPDVVTVEAATLLLDRRPVQNQNWVPAQEPIMVLQAENDVHGLSSDLGVAHDDPLAFGRTSVLELRGRGLHPGNLNLALTEGGA